MTTALIPSVSPQLGHCHPSTSTLRHNNSAHWSLHRGRPRSQRPRIERLIHSRWRDQSRSLLHQLQRREHQLAASVRPDPLELEPHRPVRRGLQSGGGEGRAGDVPTEALESLSVPFTDAHVRVQVESTHLSTVRRQRSGGHRPGRGARSAERGGRFPEARPGVYVVLGADEFDLVRPNDHRGEVLFCQSLCLDEYVKRMKPTRLES